MQTQEEVALKEVVQEPHYKNRELSVLAQLAHPNIVELKHYFTSTAGEQTTLHLLMERMETSLAAVLKDHRKRRTIPAVRTRKLVGFQLLKGLAYLEVTPILPRARMSATATSSHRTFC